MATKTSSKRAPRLLGSRKQRIAKDSPRSAAVLIREIAARAEALPPETWEGIPTDAAKNYEHYMYGSPKQK